MNHSGDSTRSDSDGQPAVPDSFIPVIWQARNAIFQAALGSGFRTMEPAVLVQQAFGGMWPSTPQETFTGEIPPSVAVTDDITIDMMGCYRPETRQVVIYTKLIERFCSQHKLDREHVEFAVRVHEYGHALVHLGVLNNMTLEDETTFLSSRLSVFKSICSPTHELLAQAITWLVLKDKPAVRETFEAMLPHQPSEYDLSPELKQGLPLETVKSLVEFIHGAMDESADELNNTARLRAVFEQP